MTREEMLQRKRELGLTYEKLSELSGVPLGTIQNYFYGYTDSPRYDTIMALEDVLAKDRSFTLHDVSADLPAYYGKQQGEYTVDDYEAFPDDQRCEIIDGVVYDMGSPTVTHQRMQFDICRQLDDHIRNNNGSCEAFIAPLDVKFPKDKKTVVQPDVLVVCDQDKIKDRIEGAPDLVVEIVSRWSEHKDKRIKLFKYAESGVREYWIVDPFEKRVLVYWFADINVNPTAYTFSMPIPVRIWDGACSVDLSRFA